MGLPLKGKVGCAATPVLRSGSIKRTLSATHLMQVSSSPFSAVAASVLAALDPRSAAADCGTLLPLPPWPSEGLGAEALAAAAQALADA